jgi:dTDP-4-amino-4,6-dideoxygalactose transaminase
MPPYAKDSCPVAEDLGCRTLSLPIYPSMTTEEQDYVIKHVRQALD